MTTLADLETRLADLYTADLQRLGRQWSIVALLPASPRAAALGEWWLWRTVSELHDRRGEPRPPEPSGQDVLSVAELLGIRDSFNALADDVEDQPLLADWCRGLAEVLTLSALDPSTDVDDAAALRDWVARQRAQRGLGTPGDTDGLPSWSQVSRPDEKR